MMFRVRGYAPLIGIFIALTLLAACEHTSARTAPPATAASSPAPEPDRGLNQDWANCALRDCGHFR